MGRIGFLVNPIAGMGGSVGLKGTDGQATLAEALRRGSKPISPERGLRFLRELKRLDTSIELLTAPGRMGEDLVRELAIRCETVGSTGPTTSSVDTVNISRQLHLRGVGLIVFCGGDGTARDVLKGVGETVAVIGVPAGVKIYSSVFAVSPIAAAELAAGYLRGEIPRKLGEVVDVDEEAFRENRLSVKLFGLLTTPDSGGLLQGTKSPSGSSEDVELDSIADYVVENMDPELNYVLGPGSTVGRIAKRLGLEKKTLLGVDAVKGSGQMLGLDLNETSLLSLLGKNSWRIIVSPIGGQGFLFGRGNQQISPAVLRRVGADDVMVVASRNKIEALHPRRLLIDSGDDVADSLFRGYARVITGYREEMVVRVE